MGKILDVDKARRILPANAVPGVAELNSNFTTYIAEVNPDTAGENMDPVDAGSTAEVAEKFKPKIEFSVKKLNKLGADEMEDETVSVTMKYGDNPKDIMNDFQSENLIVKSKTGDGERVLLDQQLDYLALEDLEERLRDQKFAKLFQSNKDGIIAALEAEIERVKKLSEQADFDSLI
jgi:hypothetical protein